MIPALTDKCEGDFRLQVKIHMVYKIKSTDTTQLKSDEQS